MAAEVDEAMPDAEAVPEELPVLSLHVLSTIKNSQMQNGLRHGDYQRYRQYCSRRLHRLRKSLKVDLRVPPCDALHLACVLACET